MARQPEYVAWLEGQDRETKEALLYGNWYVTKQREGYFKRKWTPIVQNPPYLARRVRAYDLAGSLCDEINKDPDYTAAVLVSKTADKRYTIEHAHRMRERFHTVEQYIFKQAELDGPDVTIVLPVDAGSAGKAYAGNLQRQLAEKGYHVRLYPHVTTSKLNRFRPVASICEAGFVDVVAADWNDWFFDEFELFQGDGKTHDDALDATVVGFWYLTQTSELPMMNLSSINITPGRQTPKFDFNRIGSTPSFSIPTFNISG